MAESDSKRRFGIPRPSLRPVRLRVPSLPRLRGETTTRKSTKTTKTRTKTEPKPTTKAAGRGKKAPAPNMKERIEGLQGWMAEIERKQQRMTRIGGAGLILAILAAGGALALGIINNQNAASDDDLDALREQVNGLSAEIGQQTEEQLGSLNQRIGQIQNQLRSLQQQQQQNATTISNLQQQLNQQQAAGGGGGGGGSGAQPGLPPP